MPPLSYFRVDRRYYEHNARLSGRFPRAEKPPERTAEQELHENRIALSERASG